MEIALNSSSAMGQCPTATELEVVLQELFKCIHYLHPALSKNTLRIYWGEEIHGRYLHSGRGAPFEAAISALNARDLKTKWFFVSRNFFHPKRGSENFVADIRSAVGVDRHVGEIFLEAIRDINHWLSFCSGEFDAPDVLVHGAGPKRNAAYLADLMAWLPIYAASPKHKTDEYMRRGWVVSKMDLSDADAQVALLGAVPAKQGKSRFAKFGGQYYRFLPSGGSTTRQEFHGFVVNPKLIPSALMVLIE